MARNPNSISLLPPVQEYHPRTLDAVRTPAGLPAELMGTRVVGLETIIDESPSPISALDPED